MQIDATEQPTPRSAEWLAGWDAGRAQEFKLASQVTRYRSQTDVARTWLDIERDITAEMHREIEQAQKGREKAEAERDALAAQLADARELLADVWQQFAVPGKDGKLWAGGLSTLEAVDRALHGKGVDND